MMKARHSAVEAGDGRKVVIIGAGGHAKVLIDCLRFAGWDVIGCTDADPTPRTCAGVPVLGKDEILRKLRAQGVEHAFCALGSNRVRERVGDELLAMEFSLPSVLGPGANVAPSVQVGRGAAILPGASVNIDTVIGDLAIINTNAGVDHDGVIGRAAHIGPGAALAGRVEVGDRSFVATGSAVIPGRRIGADSVVGAGSVVVRDIPAGVTAYGNPARVHRSGE